jgi:gamma-glutamyl hercynylcysteine S-oxide synthase
MASRVVEPARVTPPEPRVLATSAGNVRRAGREALSLALMESRNRTLAALNAIERALGDATPSVPRPDVNPPRWTAGHVAWYQEYAIARNVQRQRGPACDPTRPRLASVEREADAWFDPRRATVAERWSLDLPGMDRIRRYLEDTLEVTLELLAGSAEDDAALHFYRAAALREDAHVESLAEAAQGLGLRVDLFEEPALLAPREAILMPATRWQLGREAGGFVPGLERWAHEVRIPEFEIDAQPVRWAQFVEFVEDGGYDDPRWWSPEGLAWKEREARRVPRYVDQLRHGVLQQRVGRLVRVPLARPALHVSAHEADAWCRWAGRRLPTEVEWEAAAHQSAGRGFRWGEVREWTASTLRPYPGHERDPDDDLDPPGFGVHRVLRGASAATPPALRDARRRTAAPAPADHGFFGFRSCAA